MTMCMLYENVIPINMHVLNSDCGQVNRYNEGSVFIHVEFLTFVVGRPWSSYPVTDHVFIGPDGALVSRAGDKDFSRFRLLEA